MMNCLSWPEPVISVKQLSESGISVIPERYVKSPSDRPSLKNKHFLLSLSQTDGGNEDRDCNRDHDHVSIPVVDIQNVFSDDHTVRDETLSRISSACRDWGFFQIVNHGVSHELMKSTRDVWREFFNLPLEVKQEYANSPCTYEGFGSRLGVEKGAKLDWNDYYFLNFLPTSLRNESKWPARPPSCRKLIKKYGDELVKLCRFLMKVLSKNLGVGEEALPEAFGGEDIGACLRVNFYPKCPQPELTLGVSPHSDPGGLTLLLPDDDVAGLQVRRGDSWVTVKPVPNAFIVNIGDQMQVLSNAIYKSVEHRVIVNQEKERLSLAFFYNPKSDILIQPMKEFVSKEKPALYKPKTFDEYRVYIRTKGPCGKTQVESLKFTR